MSSIIAIMPWASVGLSMVEESIRVLELPRMFASVEELDYVADKVWPYYQKKFDAKGFTLQDRGEVGWVYVMSKAEVTSIANLKAMFPDVWREKPHVVFAENAS